MRREAYMERVEESGARRNFRRVFLVSVVPYILHIAFTIYMMCSAVGGLEDIVRGVAVARWTLVILILCSGYIVPLIAIIIIILQMIYVGYGIFIKIRYNRYYFNKLDYVGMINAVVFWTIMIVSWLLSEVIGYGELSSIW